jgi:hypothetical protein
MAEARPYGLDGLRMASERGVLFFGQLFGFDVYVTTDNARRLAEARRIDGKLFPATSGSNGLPARKCHTIRGSRKGWPLGIREAEDVPSILLVEGSSDFLQAHEVIHREQIRNVDASNCQCAPVALLGATTRIVVDALPFFRGKCVRIIAHNDASGAGLRGALRWKAQLEKYVQYLEVFVPRNLTTPAGATVTDLYDLSFVAPSNLKSIANLERITPHVNF